MSSVIRIQIHHDRLTQSNPYPSLIETAFLELKTKGLKERAWDKTDNPGVIRHETGAELIILAGALIELSAAILHLIEASRSHRPETNVTITISNPQDVSNILQALAQNPS